MFGINVCGKSFKEYLYDCEFWGDFKVDISSGSVWVDNNEIGASDISVNCTNLIHRIQDMSSVYIIKSKVVNHSEGKSQMMVNHYHDWFRSRKTPNNDALYVHMVLPNTADMRRFVSRFVSENNGYFESSFTEDRFNS